MCIRDRYRPVPNAAREAPPEPTPRGLFGWDQTILRKNRTGNGRESVSGDVLLPNVSETADQVLGGGEFP